MLPDGPRALFRVASSPEVGGGHVRRCLALAKAMGRVRATSFALDPDCSEDWPALLRSEGFGLCDDADEDQASQAQIVVLDDYRLTERDIAFWRARANLLVMIDDRGVHLADVDLYVSPGLTESTDANVLCGPQYALLSEEYARRVPPLPGGTEVHHLLVSFGLRDSANGTGLTLAALALLPRETRPQQLTVALGAAAPNLEEVAAKVSKLGGKLVTNAASLCEFYDASDLVIGAGGVSLFERMARGRPSITIANAQNQESQARAMADRGGTILAGSACELSPETLSILLNDLLQGKDAREAQALQGRSIVDGRGAYRAAAAINALAESRTEKQLGEVR